jgi:hypothetical protein
LLEESEYSQILNLSVVIGGNIHFTNNGEFHMIYILKKCVHSWLCASPNLNSRSNSNRLYSSILISVESPEGEISEVSSPSLEDTSDSRDLLYVLMNHVPILFLGLGIGFDAT